MALIPASANLAAVEVALVNCDQAIHSALQAMGLEVSTAPLRPVPVTPARQSGAVPTLAEWTAAFPGDKTEALYKAFVDAGAICKLHPEALYAIWCWETGRGADPHAGPWIHGWNSGGLKFNSAAEASTLGALPDPYVSASGDAKYLRFSDWHTGILGLGKFLNRDHYDTARAETTIEGQVHAIWAAGYSAMDSDWLLNVTRIAGTVQLTVAATTAAPSEVAAGGTVQNKIVAAMLSLVGHPVKSDADPNGDKDPVFHYPEGTENGNLGCASAMSQGLIIAKVITPSQLKKSVSELAHLLVDLGWTAKPKPDRPADMIVWKPAPGGTHQHIGSTVLRDGKLYAVENSSSHRAVELVLLSTFNREISYALRCPS